MHFVFVGKRFVKICFVEHFVLMVHVACSDFFKKCCKMIKKDQSF